MKPSQWNELLTLPTFNGQDISFHAKAIQEAEQTVEYGSPSGNTESQPFNHYKYDPERGDNYYKNNVSLPDVFSKPKIPKLNIEYGSTSEEDENVP